MAQCESVDKSKNRCIIVPRNPINRQFKGMKKFSLIFHCHNYITTETVVTQQITPLQLFHFVISAS